MRKNLLLITISFVTSFFALISITLVIKQRLKDLIIYNDAVVHTYQVINQLQQVTSFVKDVETGTRGYLLSGDSVFLKPYLSSLPQVAASLNALVFLIQDNVPQTNQYKLLKVDVTLKMDIMSRYVMLKSKNQVIGVNDEMRKGNSLMTDIRNRVESMRNVELILLNQRQKLKERYEGITPTYLSISLALSLIITVVCFFFILREFKTRTNYQKQLETSIEDLNNSNNELQQIAEISSHDLQEPLRKLRLFTSKLMYNTKNLIDEGAKKTVERIDAAAQQMEDLIDDVVVYNNINKHTIVKTQLNLNQEIEELSSEYVVKNGLEIIIEILPKIVADRKQIRLLLKHLLDNAIKFAKPNTNPAITIKYVLANGSFLSTSKQSEQYHKITVSDAGIGFKAEYADKLFTIFGRLHGNETEYTGKGIGLAICKKIMISHNGYISVKGKENEGTIFSIYFPLKG